MENVLSLIMTFMWGLMAFYYAKKVKERYPKIELEPVNYIFGGLLFGAWSIVWCMCKSLSYARKK